jgi:hypothetical protein
MHRRFIPAYGSGVYESHLAMPSSAAIVNRAVLLTPAATVPQAGNTYRGGQLDRGIVLIAAKMAVRAGTKKT